MFQLSKIFVPGAIVVNDLLAIIDCEAGRPVSQLLPANGPYRLLAATSDIRDEATEDHLHAVPGFAEHSNRSSRSSFVLSLMNLSTFSALSYRSFTAADPKGFFVLYVLIVAL
jgi:hypothetical protein